MAITREDLRQELVGFAAKADLERFAIKEDLERFATREDLERFATKEDLERFATNEDLERFATKEDLERFASKEDLERFATKEDLNRTNAALEAHREETAQGFADQRRYMEILYEDLKATIRTILETVIGRADARDVVVERRLGDHEQRLNHVELRVTKLEH